MNEFMRVHETGWRFEHTLASVGLAMLVAMIVHLIFAGFTSRDSMRPRRGWIAGFVYYGFFAIVLGLAATSFGSIFIDGSMEHWWLLLHMLLSGAFVFVMLAFSIMWNPLVLTRHDLQESEPWSDLGDSWWLTTCSLWLVQLASIAVAGSMLLSMLPIFDTEAMKEVLTVHRYAGLVLAASFIVNLYSFTIQRLGWR